MSFVATAIEDHYGLNWASAIGDNNAGSGDCIGCDRSSVAYVMCGKAWFALRRNEQRVPMMELSWFEAVSVQFRHPLRELPG